MFLNSNLKVLVLRKIPFYSNLKYFSHNLNTNGPKLISEEHLIRVLYIIGLNLKQVAKST